MPFIFILQYLPVKSASGETGGQEKGSKKVHVTLQQTDHRHSRTPLFGRGDNVRTPWSWVPTAHSWGWISTIAHEKQDKDSVRMRWARKRFLSLP